MSPHRAANESCWIPWGRRKAERHMTGRRQGAFVAIALAGQLAATSIAAAQPVPLPPPARLPKTGAPGAAPQPPGAIPNGANRPSAPAQSGQQAQGGQPAQSSSPLQQLREWLPPFLGGGGGEEQQQQQQPQQQPQQQQ